MKNSLDQFLIVVPNLLLALLIVYLIRTVAKLGIFVLENDFTKKESHSNLILMYVGTSLLLLLNVFLFELEIEPQIILIVNSLVIVLCYFAFFQTKYFNLVKIPSKVFINTLIVILFIGAIGGASYFQKLSLVFSILFITLSRFIIKELHPKKE